LWFDPPQLLQNFQTGYGTHPASNNMGTGEEERGGGGRNTNGLYGGTSQLVGKNNTDYHVVIFLLSVNTGSNRNALPSTVLLQCCNLSALVTLPTGEVFPFNATTASWGRTCLTPHILNLGASWKQRVLVLRRLKPGKEPRTMGGPQRRSG